MLLHPVVGRYTFVFFSSRRRHTRFDCDWSSDVCSSDLPPSPNPPVQGQRLEARDGDTVILEGDARVNIVRRRQAHVRAVFNQAQASLLLLVSHVVADAGTAGLGGGWDSPLPAPRGGRCPGGACGGGAVLGACPNHAGPGAPLGVGAAVAPPRKIFDAPPILPEQARQPGIRGVVILEITIGTDGTVIDARVLRSIPLLDSAALECARQWRYEPVLLNGRPVPI